MSKQTNKTKDNGVLPDEVSVPVVGVVKPMVLDDGDSRLPLTPADFERFGQLAREWHAGYKRKEGGS